MADDQDGAAIALEEVLQPHHAFEVEIVGGLVQQQQIGRREQDRRQRHAHAPAAGKFRGRAAAGLPPKSPGRPESPRRGPARYRRRSRPAGDRCRPAGGRRFRARLRPEASVRSGSASSTVSSRLTSVPGASCATAPTRQARGQLTSPSSGCSWPRITLNRVDLPAPLRPTRPMRRPAGRLAVAPYRISRPAIRTMMLSIASIWRAL